MNRIEELTGVTAPSVEEAGHDADDMLAWVRRPMAAARRSSFDGVVVGELLALTGDGAVPLVLFPGQPGSAAVRARSVVDLGASDVGQLVVLTFEAGDPASPIVMGVIRGNQHAALQHHGACVEADVDGARLVVAAREQLVLRCGAASITLTKAGKVLIQGEYVSTRASGVNRVKGGTVEIN